MVEKPDGLVLWAGIAAPIVGLAGIVLAALTAPSFSPIDHGLSHLGAMEGISSLFFNAGIILTGVVAFPFGIFLALTPENSLEKYGVASVWIGVFAMFLLGFFTMDAYPTLHLLLGLLFFIGITVAFFLYGAGNVVAGDVQHGLRTIGLGVVHETGWLVWGATVLIYTDYNGPLLETPGIFFPELLGILVLIAWATRTAYGPRAEKWSEIGPDQEPEERGPGHREA